MELSRQLLEAMSWRLVSEMARRYPEVKVIETHPGGGLYDCLDLRFAGDHSLAHPSIALNREGSAHFFDSDGYLQSWDSFWDDYLAAADPKAIIDRVCERASLPTHEELPASTPPVVTYRFIAAFLAHALLGRRRWECRNGYFDSSGAESGRNSWFDSFAAAAHLVDVRLPDDLLGNSAYRFWFLLLEGRPQLCLETTGMAWDLEGTEFDLMRLYRVRHRIWPVVSFVGGDLLP